MKSRKNEELRKKLCYLDVDSLIKDFNNNVFDYKTFGEKLKELKTKYGTDNVDLTLGEIIIKGVDFK